MQLQPGRAKRLGLVGAAATLVICVIPATGAAQFAGVSKSCAQISGCTAVVLTPPRVGAGGPGVPAPPPGPSSRFGITVATAPTSTPGTQSQSGQLTEKVDLGRGVRCRGYKPRDSTIFVFKLLTATPTRITYAIADRITNTTTNGIQFCLAANFAFKTASGAPAPSTVLPDGTSGHVGLLPRCAHPALPAGLAGRPCVAGIATVKDKNSTTGVDVILRVRVPTLTDGDPWGGS
jgi:hypothetical protein